MDKLEQFRKDLMDNLITKSDIGKKFKVDNHHDVIVQLLDIRADGWVDALDKDGQKVVLNAVRLSPLEESDLLTRILDEGEASEKVYIKKVEKILIVGKNEQGDTVEQVLKDEEAEKWHDYTRGLSFFAMAHGVNPDYTSLKWKKKITKKA
jgi:hypothetical protein